MKRTKISKVNICTHILKETLTTSEIEALQQLRRIFHVDFSGPTDNHLNLVFDSKDVYSIAYGEHNEIIFNSKP